MALPATANRENECERAYLASVVSMIVHLVLALGILANFPTPTLAQQPSAVLEGEQLFVEPSRILLELRGEGAQDQFGWVTRKVGDLDRDGAVDFVVTAPTWNGNAGKIYVYSSRRGALLFAREGFPDARLGNGAAGAGDVNGDGIPDVIAGAPGANRAFVFSGTDGEVLWELQGESSSGGFGYKVCGLGDVDQDGHADVAVTAWKHGHNGKGTGRCLGFSGRTGKRLFSLDGEAAEDKFGSAVAASENAEHPLLAIGAQDAGEEDRGAVYVYRLAGVAERQTPELQFKLGGDQASRELGKMFVAFPGDFDGDGVPDVFASDFQDTTAAPGAGRVRVYSARDGSQLLTLAGTHPQEGFGTSISDAGDADGDGVADLIVGAWQHSSAARGGGRVTLYSGRSGQTLQSWTCRQAGETLGFDATGLGDVDGDGRIDFLVSSAWSRVRGPRSGRVFILAGSEPDAADAGRK